MAKQSSPAPSAPQVVSDNDVPRMPYETEGRSEETTMSSLLAMLGSDEEDPSPAEQPAEETAEPDEEPEHEAPESEESEEVEAPEPSEPESPPPAPESVKLHLDGREVEITLDELKKGYLRESDYTRKTQAVSEEAKRFEAERSRYAEAVTRLDQALAEIAPQEPDWDRLRQERPEDYAAEWADWQRLQQDRAAVAAEQARLRQEQEQEAAKQLHEVLRAESERLLDAIPEWKDAAKAKAEKAELAEYAQKMGFSDDDLARVTDHRVIVMLRKAALYDRLNTKGKERLEEKRQPAPKVLKPGAAEPPKRTTDARAAAIKALRRTGSEQDAMAALLASLPD